MTYSFQAEQRKGRVASFAKAEFTRQAWRWKSNGQIPFPDMFETWVEEGFVTATEAESSNAIREAETFEFLQAYRASQPKQPSAEERAEALAAFGPGETVVDVISGRTYTT